MRLVNFILGSFPLLIQQYADHCKKVDLHSTLVQLQNDLSLPRIPTFDYIVVGGGSAGCVLAGRLSEKFSVLLLESGGDPVPATYTTYLDNASVIFHPAINNIFYSTKQKHFSLQSDGIFKITAGRMLGGSGSHNDNIYNRGSPRDYDNFAKVTQDNSWSYGNVLKYFKKMENYVGRLINEEERAAYYGSGGPINVVTAMQPPRLLPHWLKAGQELGYQVADPNGHQIESFTPMAYSMAGGEKDNSYISYIKPIEASRKSLRVLRFSEVQQVLIHYGTKRAYGVIYRRHGIPQVAHASHEVILSAGAISSPLLLIKSGIGPKTLLDEAKIPVIMDVPGVGQNLHDHSGVFLPFNLNHINDDLLPQIRDDNVEAELVKFQSPSPPGSDRGGIFATPFGMGQAFLASSRAKGEGQGDWPDLRIYIQHRPYTPNRNRSTRGADILVVLSLTRQKSVGMLGFNTTAYLNGIRDDTKLALMDNRFYTERSDVLVLVEGIQVVFKVFEKTEAFAGLNAQYLDEIPTPCQSLAFRSDEFWACHIQYKSEYWAHAMGTAKMGALKEDPNAVVDSKLRVRGIGGLRVVDASIFPTTTNANINAPVMMVAEKLADEILQGHHLGGPRISWPSWKE